MSAKINLMDFDWLSFSWKVFARVSLLRESRIVLANAMLHVCFGKLFSLKIVVAFSPRLHSVIRKAKKLLTGALAQISKPDIWSTDLINILNDSDFQMCFWATFSSDRGQADLVVGAAFSFAVRMQPECRVVVFGDGPLRAAARGRAGAAVGPE